MKDVQQLCNALALLIIKKVNYSEFNLDRQSFDNLDRYNLFLHTELYLFKSSYISVYPIVYIALNTFRIYFLSIQFCYYVGKLFLIVLTQQSQCKNSKNKPYVFYITRSITKFQFVLRVNMESRQKTKGNVY